MISVSQSSDKMIRFELFSPLFKQKILVLGGQIKFVCSKLKNNASTTKTYKKCCPLLSCNAGNTHTRDTHTMTCINTLLIYDISDLYIINKLLQSFVSSLDDAE